MALSSVSGERQSGYVTGHDGRVLRDMDRNSELSSVTQWRLEVRPRMIGAQCLRRSRNATFFLTFRVAASASSCPPVRCLGRHGVHLPKRAVSPLAICAQVQRRRNSACSTARRFCMSG